jgi:hypothetical protein
VEDPGFVTHFKEFFPRLVVYLAMPFYLGIQFAVVAKEERRASKESSAGSYALDVFGLFFSVIVPAFIIVSSLAIFKMGARYPDVMGGLFRYGLMFFFFGMWWQFFVVMALKAYKDRDRQVKKLNYLLFYAAGSVFVSLVAFLGGEWFLKWMSLVFLAAVSPILLLSCRKMVMAFLAAAAVAFLAQTAGFIYVSSMI